jgi:SAM-dependent methyltransferase
MNYQFRAAGGTWTWGQVYPDGIPEMSAFLGDPVSQVQIDHFPFESGSFDVVITIDLHEHFRDIRPLNQEIARVLRPGGLAVITTPNGNTMLPVAALKRLIGMGPEHYGHVVQGYRVTELQDMLRAVDLRPKDWGGYSRFFTELAELVINFTYVKVLSKRKKHPEVVQGSIAPTSRSELEAVRREYRVYSFIYPVMYVLSLFDRLIPGRSGYAVAVSATKSA